MSLTAGTCVPSQGFAHVAWIPGMSMLAVIGSAGEI